MWLLVWITVLLSRAVMANLTDESAYYLAETNDNRSLDRIEKPRYEKSGLETSEARSSSKTEEDRAENRAVEDSIDNHGPKRSITNADLRDKSSGQRQAPAPLATLLYWPESEDQVVGMEQRRNPLMQERRNPAFSPWGGKRDVQQQRYTITKIQRPVRVPFSSWGGKRDGERLNQRAFADNKRGKFFSWGGKRAPSINSWSGKGGTSGIIDAFDPSTNYRYYQRHRKSIVDVGQRVDNDLDSTEEKYHVELTNNNETGEKRGFVELMASGEMTTSGSTMGETFPRVPFQPWGGMKRFLGCSNDGSSSASVSLILRKRGRSIPLNAQVI